MCGFWLCKQWLALTEMTRSRLWWHREKIFMKTLQNILFYVNRSFKTSFFLCPLTFCKLLRAMRAEKIRNTCFSFLPLQSHYNGYRQEEDLLYFFTVRITTLIKEAICLHYTATAFCVFVTDISLVRILLWGQNDPNLKEKNKTSIFVKGLLLMRCRSCVTLLSEYVLIGYCILSRIISISS